MFYSVSLPFFNNPVDGSVVSMVETMLIVKLYAHFDTYKYSAGQTRTIYKAGIAVGTLVKIVLVGVENIFDTGIYLHSAIVRHLDVVCNFQRHIEKLRCFHLLVFFDISGKVLYQHATGICSGKRKLKRIEHSIVDGEISVMVRSAEHSGLSLHIVRPLFGFLVSTLLIGIAQLEV